MSREGCMSVSQLLRTSSAFAESRLPACDLLEGGNKGSSSLAPQDNHCEACRPSDLCVCWTTEPGCVHGGR